MNMPDKLPDWFDWADYEVLANVDIEASWAYFFAIRDLSFDEARSKGVGSIRTINPTTDSDVYPQLFWSKGVLSIGMKGHDTHGYLQAVIEHAAKKANFIPEDKFVELQKNGKLTKGHVYITNSIIRNYKRQGGRLEFENEEASRKYQEIETAMYGRTVELAINYSMPKKLILQEVERLIDEQQKYWKPKVKKIKNATSSSWARGLACWDLIQDDITQYQLAKLLAPLWSGELPETENTQADDIDKTKVKRAIESVRPYIEGGWRVLSGDPLVSQETELLEPK